MEDLIDLPTLSARAESHAALLETAASLMELDGIGVDPEQGHVHLLRRMAGSIRAQAALGRRAQRYTGGRYLPAPSPSSNKQEPPCPASSPTSFWH
jgi:hypothetical protein